MQIAAASQRLSDHLPPPTELTPAGLRIVLLASLGGGLEFFDFVVFGIFARDIGEAIFPSQVPLVSLMAAFAAFGAGYLARPLGGIVLSHFGDVYGRRRVFLLSLAIMSLATLGMGLVPTYAAWGAAASALMVALRLTQGFSLGGELPGALTYVVETAPRRAPFVCGIVFSCVTLGVAVATGVSLLLRTVLPPALVGVYGWRLAFVIGGLGGVLSFVLRRSLEESPEFARMKQLAARRPFWELLQNHASVVVVGVSLLAGTAAFNGLFFSHMAAYMTGVLGYDARFTVFAQTTAVVVHAISILVVGRLADRVSPRLLLRTGAGTIALLAFPFYIALAGHLVSATILLVAAGIVASLLNGTFAVLLTDLFPTRLRFTGVALAFNIAFTIFSGTAPLVATSLIRMTDATTSPALLMIVCGAITLLGTFARSHSGNVLLRDKATR